MKKKFIVALFSVLYVGIIQAQYISEILDYKPAPGQFINTNYGSPSACESIIGGVTGCISLGAFGGYVVFRFENPVENHPDNPFGVDFTVFGNPPKDPITQEVIWAEHGVVSVMKDENGNGLPDDTWYELAGSDYFFSSTIKNYAITYTNPHQETAANVPWADNQGNSGNILINEYHNQPYYPSLDLFPDIDPDTYTLTGTRIEEEVDKTDTTNIKSCDRAFGYADNKPRDPNTNIHTIPDNPYTKERENSGGDAFDISWAVDENGNYVDLDVIHFVKIHTAILENAGWLGEVSTEIAGAVDIPPDNSVSGVPDMIVIKHLPDTITDNDFKIEVAVFKNGRFNPNADITWSTNLAGANINNNNILHFTENGEIKITASLVSNPSITASDSTVLNCDDLAVKDNSNSKISLYPNPASEKLFVHGVENASIEIFDLTGKQIIEQTHYQNKQAISISHLEKGMYILKVSQSDTGKTFRFVKQ